MNNISSDNIDKLSIFKSNNDKLCDLIAKLSKGDLTRNENELKDVANAFNELYLDNDFRHQYSSITKYIINDLNSSNESTSFAYDFSSVVNTLYNLSENLNYLYSNFIVNSDEKVKLSYNKLCDHINLEIVRFNYFQTQFDALQQDFKTVESACNDLKEQKDTVSSVIKEFNNINEVEGFRKCDIMVTRDNALPLKEGEYYFCDVIGCKVLDVDDRDSEIGEVTDVIETGANNVFAIRTPEGKEVLFPVIPECIKEVNTEEKIVRAHVMNGLMD